MSTGTDAAWECGHGISGWFLSVHCRFLPCTHIQWVWFVRSQGKCIVLGGISMKHKKIDKFQILANSVMIVVTLAAILPFILLFMSSITDESVLLNNGYGFWPEVFHPGGLCVYF